MKDETICINKKVFNDVIEEIQLMKESLELMQDKDFMESHKRAKEQIKKRDFVDWNELQNNSN